MRSELSEQRPLVEHRVDKIRIVVKRVRETGIQDLQCHANDLFEDSELLLENRTQHDLNSRQFGMLCFPDSEFFLFY